MLLDNRIASHYGRGTVLESIEQGLRLAGKSTGNLTLDDLAPVDEFHSRGKASTEELLSLAPIRAADKVLDVGCGLGGSARLIADRVACEVTGVDLTAEYIDVARTMTSWVGMTDQVRFTQATALQLPFADSSFDVVWTEHAQMNIRNKQQFYHEIARVLRPGGRLMFHDIFGGSTSAVFPLPWAGSEEISSLMTDVDAMELMQRAGLDVKMWIGKCDESLRAFETALERMATSGVPPLGIHLLMGSDAHQKIKNYLASMRSGAINVAMGVCTRI